VYTDANIVMGAGGGGDDCHYYYMYTGMFLFLHALFILLTRAYFVIGLWAAKFAHK
jgi:hypothetical protein